MRCYSATKPIRRASVVAYGLLAMVATTAQGALIVDENFDDITVPASPGFLNLAAGTSGSALSTSVVAGTGGTIRAEIDSADLFDDGETNQFLRFVDGGSGTPIARGPASLGTGTAFQFSFDFYHPQVGGPGAGEAGGANGGRVFLTTSATAADRTVEIRLARGSVNNENAAGSAWGVLTYLWSVNSSGQEPFIYELNKTHHIDIVGNYSATDTITYGAFNQESVAPQRYDLWFNNELVYDDVVFRAATATSSTQFGFAGSGADQISTQLFDNIEIWNEIDFAPVPEPHSLVLLGLGAAGLAACRRWRS